MSPLPIHTPEWTETIKFFLAKETKRWQGPGFEPPTVRSEVQRVNYYATAPSTAFDIFTIRQKNVSLKAEVRGFMVCLRYRTGVPDVEYDLNKCLNSF